MATNPLLSGFYSLFRDENKVSDEAVDPNQVLLPELELSMDDDELIALKRLWMQKWEPYGNEVAKKQDEAENYWLGIQFQDTASKRPLIDNLTFEALETFLPIATRPRPEPLVEADNTEYGNAVADKVRKMLAFIIDDLRFNLQLKQVARYWALYMLGVMKVGWSMKENDITCVPVRPQKLIFDPDATIREGEYTGHYLGEWLDDMASDLVVRFPKKKKIIEDKVHGNMGTKVKYVFWTTDDYWFWTLDDEVLGKTKNAHWNYDQSVPLPMDEFGQVPTDPATGQPLQTTQPGRNHFKNRKKPYIFLSIFNLGKHPHDDTNVVLQTLPLQDLINKRLSQIDKNADNANNSLAVSGDFFTQKQAAEAAKAKRSGGVIWVPTGDVQKAVQVLGTEQLPPFVYQSLMDYRNEMRNIFGVRGSTAQGTIGEQTVGGKQIIRGQDVDRIGGGVSTYLEQFSDLALNWFVQLMYVYYDEPHYAAVLGKERAGEYIQLVNSEFGRTKLLVSVKDGSMIPKDPMSQRNEAITLMQAGNMDPITFFDRLEFPNPRESAKQLYLWKANPIALFPDLMAQQQAEMMAQQQAQQAQAQQQATVEASQGQQQRQHEMAMALAKKK